jgi:hypothetical protein
MALATHTVGINAAFLQEIKDDHHELRQLMHHTAAMFARSPGETELDRLADLLTRLRDQLAMHFSLEEAYGYFEDAISLAPRLCRRAENLRAEHSTLYSDLCNLAERAEQLPRNEDASSFLEDLTGHYHDFSTRLAEHESRETDLIHEAFHDDIGCGD